MIQDCLRIDLHKWSPGSLGVSNVLDTTTIVELFISRIDLQVEEIVN